MKAYRSRIGVVKLHKKTTDEDIPLEIPCGGCLGCRMAYAQSWALRCQLELQQHTSAVFTTLTYNEENVPITLPKPAEGLPPFLKRLRKNTNKKLRFYATAEYGERTHRPHYHAIIYGLSPRDGAAIEAAWQLGHTRTEEITPARIAYTAGYCNKKTEYKHIPHERHDPTTGEVYTWQPPYKLMSRRPGIGAAAKRFLNSWRMYAVKDGHKMPVPRFLHEAWKQQATEQEKEALIYEKYKLKLTRESVNQEAAEQIAYKQQQLNHEKRKYTK